jgi:hypothetical protein
MSSLKTSVPFGSGSEPTRLLSIFDAASVGRVLATDFRRLGPYVDLIEPLAHEAEAHAMKFEEEKAATYNRLTEEFIPDLL